VPFVIDSAPYTAIRFALYAALIAVLGASAFVLLPLRRVRGLGLGSDLFAEEAAGAARQIAIAGATVLVLALPARLIAQSLAIFDAPFDILPAIASTSWGRAWLLQLAGALFALVFAVRARALAVLPWRATGLGAIAVALGFALSGHAAAAEHLSSLAVALDTAHVVAAGAWVGTLAALAFAGIPAAMRGPAEHRASTAAALVRAFSPVALASAAVLAASGVFAAWDQLGTIGQVVATPYGRTLLVKLALVAVMAAIGAVNWRVLTPKLGTEEACHGIRRSAVRELAVAVLVIAVTAILVAMPTHDEQGRSSRLPSRDSGTVTGVAVAD